MLCWLRTVANEKKSRLKVLFYVGFLVLLVAQNLGADDYRRQDRKVPSSDFALWESRTMRLALSLAKASNAIPSDRFDEFVEAVENGKPIPRALSNTWQKFLRLAHTHLILQSTQKFYPVGFEAESNHSSIRSSRDFAAGAEALKEVIQKVAGMKISHIDSQEDKATLIDDSDRTWTIVREWARRNETSPSGWEINSPVFTKPESLESATTWIYLMGQSPFGKSNQLSSVQQTFDLTPPGQSADSHTMGLVAANVMLLTEQFTPAIFETLQVKRWTGPLNIFFRPMAFDHIALLHQISSMDPEKLDLQALHNLMFKDNIIKEFNIQVFNELLGLMVHPSRTDLTQSREAQHWPDERKAQYKLNWKYRPIRIRFDLKKPSRTLIEARMADYEPTSPEIVALETLLFQRLIAKANALAKEGKLWNIDIPDRVDGTSDKAYWKELSSHHSTSVEAMLQALDISDPVEKALFTRTTFDPSTPGFKASEHLSYAFEMEGKGNGLVHVILPRDPKLRAQWRLMNKSERIAAMERLGFKFHTPFSEEKEHILNFHFFTDHERLPFLCPEIDLETSGNWEIKSNLRGFADEHSMKEAVNSISKAMELDYFAAHFHAFIPERYLKGLGKKDINRFTDLLERMSFFMNLSDYAESKEPRPSHELDSWSVDRFSPKDLEAIRAYLEGREPLKKDSQKYHNIGFRPVKGGLDLELRDIGDQVDFGVRLLSRLQNALLNQNFGPSGLEKDPPLFYEFKDHLDLESVKKYTLSETVGKKYTLTEKQRQLLNKMQFEIYKPSMGEYVYFDEYCTLEELLPKYLDMEDVRTNFENHVAIPLLNYDQQSFLTAEHKKMLRIERERFIDKVYQLMLRVEADERYGFLLGYDNFHHLCEFMAPSRHPSRPNLNLVAKPEANRQRDLLEELTYETRALVTQFARKTRVDQMVEQSLPKEPPLDRTISLSPQLKARVRDSCQGSLGDL